MKKEIPSAKTGRRAKGRRRLAACTLFSALALCLIHSPAREARASAVDGHYTSASLSAQERKAGNLLNLDRANYNLPNLTIDPELCRIARIKSEDMRDNQYFAHTSPTYGDVRDMLDHFGYSYSAASENIAHHATLDKAQAALLSSVGHRKNIMSKSFTKVGLGVAQDKNGYVYLTQIFVR